MPLHSRDSIYVCDVDPEEVHNYWFVHAVRVTRQMGDPEEVHHQKVCTCSKSHRQNKYLLSCSLCHSSEMQ